jgi:peroxiredoxin
MAATPSTMLALGTPAPDFALPDVATGRTLSLADLANKDALLVIFMCAHCPFVVHVKDELARLGRDYAARNVGIVGITANDIESYPQDAPAPTATFARQAGITFPILYDETQAVAKAYTAACTPDLFLFDRNRRLVYRGQLDSSRPGRGTANGADLRAALDALLSGKPVNPDQQPSIGCNIKWKAGNEPKYFRS